MKDIFIDIFETFLYIYIYVHISDRLISTYIRLKVSIHQGLAQGFKVSRSPAAPPRVCARWQVMCL